MPLKTKIVLSDKELALVKNEDWILTKQQVIQKVYEILSQCIREIEEMPLHTGEATGFPTEPPKISKGENYRGLPYVTLDYPRLFNNENIFAIRTMFWWGKFFSITFHVAGHYKKVFADRIIANYTHLHAGTFLCIHKEQWHHHFEADNYVPVESLSRKQLESVLAEKNFIKIALKYNLDQFNMMQELLIDGYKKIGKMIA